VFSGNLVNALGNTGGTGGAFNIFGGSGGNGRLFAQYCESFSGTTNPSTSTQKLNCYIADQAPGNTQQGQLNIPSNTAQTYQIQYGRKLNFASASNQLSQLRVPAGLLSSLTLDGLVSGLSGNTSLSLDVGDDGTTDWTGTASNNSTTAINTAAIVNVFSSYWAAHGAPSTGTLDVPVRVSLGGAGQILLTNMQAQLASSSLRYIKLPVRNYTQFLLDFTAGSAGQVLAALDVGDDGSIDWNAPAPDTAPKRWLTGDLKTAINAYLAGKSGDVELPIRIYVTPSGTANLNDYEAIYAASTDLVATSIGLGPTVNALAGPEATDYNAGDVLTLQANLGNSSGTNSGPLTAAFFAYAEGWGDWYVGSAFVSNIVPGGSATIRATWNTTGFGGNVPVKVVVNPYGRTGETSFGNNAKTMTVTVTPQKADQTITFGELTSRLMGDPAFVVVATASSGLMLTFTSLTPAVCSVAGNTVSLLVPGLCTVRASQPGSLYFNAAASVDRSFVVRDPNKLDQMIAFAALADKTYGDAAFAVSATSSAGLAVRMESLTPSVCIVANDTVTVVAAGACTLRASQLGNATYNPALPVDRNFVVQKANQVITFGALPDRALSEGAFTVSATSSSGLPVSFRSLTTGVCSVSASTVSLLSLGQCSVEASQEGNGNVNAATAQVRSFKVVGSGGTQGRVFLPMVLK